MKRTLRRSLVCRASVRAGYVPDLRDPLRAADRLSTWAHHTKTPKLQKLLQPYVRLASHHLRAWVSERDEAFEEFQKRETVREAQTRGRVVVRCAVDGTLATMRTTKPFQIEPVRDVHVEPHKKIMRLHHWIETCAVRAGAARIPPRSSP